ncbi:esterase/lipase family protein, partial [Pseudomonas aeruginosa]
SNPVMGLMEMRLDNIVIRRELEAWWPDEAHSPPGNQGEEKGKVGPIDEEGLIRASRYQLAVWCAGYNWLQSNVPSALDVRHYI